MTDRKDTASNRAPGDPETTGHVWDGIEEFNNPLPRWWLWVFYLTIIWALGYTIAYPAWPLIERATPGLLGYSTRAEVAKDIAAVEARNADLVARLEQVDLAAIADDPALSSFANQAGAAVFRTWCAQCHGAGAAGVQAAGYPNLRDDDWLWGGTLDDIVTTVRHGIRNEDDPDARFSAMPAFGTILSEDEIAAVVQHVRAISGQSADAALAATGAEVFANNCVACHGTEGGGNPLLGAPALNDAIWLYGGDVATLTETVTNARAGVMPAWSGRLAEAEVRAVASYVHGLGGGQ
ncbi:MAG: cytochrome-c oxidase, cbb3-type subunit III [Rhodobacteraceae bacterium]|nr:cytochrome-c oxidase, cbb3-type subunit III [Paracoccaceae bacterium]